MPLLHPTKTVQSSSQEDFRNFVQVKNTIANILTDLIAIDGLSFYTIAKSKRLQKFTLAKGQKIPSGSIFIKSILLDHITLRDIKSQLTAELTDMKANNFRFSLTVDKYTSIKTCCYMILMCPQTEAFIILDLYVLLGECHLKKLLR